LLIPRVPALCILLPQERRDDLRHIATHIHRRPRASHVTRKEIAIGKLHMARTRQHPHHFAGIVWVTLQPIRKISKGSGLDVDIHSPIPLAAKYKNGFGKSRHVIRSPTDCGLR
jgi:hypothetical protein